MSTYTVSRSTRDNKRYMVRQNGRLVTHFGQPNAFTYADGAPVSKKNAYIARHSRNGESWTKRGINTAGFWARWMLWNKGSLRASASDMRARFNISVNVTK